MSNKEDVKEITDRLSKVQITDELDANLYITKATNRGLKLKDQYSNTLEICWVNKENIPMRLSNGWRITRKDMLENELYVDIGETVTTGETFVIRPAQPDQVLMHKHKEVIKQEKKEKNKADDVVKKLKSKHDELTADVTKRNINVVNI